MLTIWDKFIQNLLLSKDNRNILLACALVEDKMSIRCWAWYTVGYPQFQLPGSLRIYYIVNEHYPELWRNVSLDRIQNHMKQAYENWKTKHME